MIFIMVTESAAKFACSKAAGADVIVEAVSTHLCHTE